jgi:hypothetical protein
MTWDGRETILACYRRLESRDESDVSLLVEFWERRNLRFHSEGTRASERPAEARETRLALASVLPPRRMREALAVAVPSGWAGRCCRCRRLGVLRAGR